MLALRMLRSVRHTPLALCACVRQQANTVSCPATGVLAGRRERALRHARQPRLPRPRARGVVLWFRGAIRSGLLVLVECLCVKTLEACMYRALSAPWCCFITYPVRQQAVICLPVLSSHTAATSEQWEAVSVLRRGKQHVAEACGRRGRGQVAVADGSADIALGSDTGGAPNCLPAQKAPAPAIFWRHVSCKAHQVPGLECIPTPAGAPPVLRMVDSV